MVFSSSVFLFLFLPIVLIIYYNPIFKSRIFRNVFLLMASLAFYAWGEPVFVFLMLFSIIITWLIGIQLQKRQSKALLTIGIAYHIAVLFIFKYLTFVVKEIGFLLHTEYMMDIPLPIGISFFSFQLMSYLFDIYYRKANAQRNPLYVGLYVSLFPQLIAGPIVRYEHIADEIADRRESIEGVTAGMQRFIYGMGKKVLLSNYMAQIADNTFGYLSNQSVLTAWLGAIAYTLQIYFDFSGYSDMAIGLGEMFGFHFGENFKYPYISKSVTEFWRRWHISLSSWFRDYVYIPLGGNRVSKKRWIWNLFAVWLLTGIWHGANWTFILWGLFYFVVLLAEKIFKFPDKMGWFSHIYTMLLVTLAWVVFRSESVSEAFRYIGNMFGVGATGFADRAFGEYLKATLIVLILAIIGCMPIIPKLRRWLEKRKIEWLESLWVLLVFILSLLQVVSSSYNPFIYFNF